MKRLAQITLLAFFTLFVAACAPDLSSSSYSGGQVNTASEAASGVIVSKRGVKINNNSQIGGVIGTVGGAVAGSAIGGGTRANILGGLGGAAAGALIGNAIDQGIHTQQGYEYIIKLDKGKTIAVTQSADNNLAVGTKVLVVYGEKVRVVPQ